MTGGKAAGGGAAGIWRRIGFLEFCTGRFTLTRGGGERGHSSVDGMRNFEWSMVIVTPSSVSRVRRVVRGLLYGLWGVGGISEIGLRRFPMTGGGSCIGEGERAVDKGLPRWLRSSSAGREMERRVKLARTASTRGVGGGVHSGEHSVADSVSGGAVTSAESANRGGSGDPEYAVLDEGDQIENASSVVLP